MYEVIDRKTAQVVGIYKTLKTARRAVDRLDNIYGGYRYHHRRVESPSKEVTI